MKGKTFEGTIEVMGHGEVAAPPDEAIVMLDVITQGKTASAAVSANAKRMQAVIEAVSEEPNHGVTTTGLGVYPIYEYNPETNTTTITGFRATNGVRVKTKPGTAGQVFDAGIEAGANVSSGIVYRIEDEAPLREQALRLAVESAFVEAGIVADTAGVTLLGPQAIAIDPVGRPIMLRNEQLAADAAPTPVIPEDLIIEANVRMTFKTKVG